MHSDSAFYFTFNPGGAYKRRDATNFEYPFSFFEDLGAEFGFDLIDLSESYQHPRGQCMARASRCE